MALAMVGIGIRIVNLHTIVKEAMVRQDHMIDALDKLVTMHEHADDFGFGTKKTNNQLHELLKAIASAVAESRRTGESLHRLIHYITFDIKQRTGKEPPPAPPNGGQR
jgi:hypothetical protein